MLKLKMYPNDVIKIGDDIIVKFEHSSGNKAFICVDAPRELKIERVDAQSNGGNWIEKSNNQ